MPKLPAFAWPPGWIEKGRKLFLAYDGASDTVVAKSPNVVGVTKVGPGVYDVQTAIVTNPGIFAGVAIHANDGTGVPLAIGTSAPGPSDIVRIHVTTLAGAPADGYVSWLQFQVPDSFAGP